MRYWLIRMDNRWLNGTKLPNLLYKESEVLGCTLLCNSYNEDVHIKYRPCNRRRQLLEIRRRQFDTAKGKKGTYYIAGYVAVDRTLANFKVHNQHASSKVLTQP